MSFKRFVETGRVAYIVGGPNKGKLCCIVDIVDQTRVLVDGPLTGVARQAVRIKEINLTKFRVKFPRSGGTGVVRKAWKEGKIDEKWKHCQWANRLVNKKKRLATTDFDRFKLKRAITMRNRFRTPAYFKLKKAACREGKIYGVKKIPLTPEHAEIRKAKAEKKEALLKERKAKKAARNKECEETRRLGKIRRRKRYNAKKKALGLPVRPKGSKKKSSEKK